MFCRKKMDRHSGILYHIHSSQLMKSEDSTEEKTSSKLKRDSHDVNKLK